MSSRGQLPSSVSAAVYEALVAAIYMDSERGLEDVRRFIQATATEHITKAAESEHQRNFKSQLQQYAQKELSSTPAYDLLDEKGPDHSKCFEIAVVVARRRFSSAWGPNKKDAEQLAAQRAIEELEGEDADEQA